MAHASITRHAHQDVTLLDRLTHLRAHLSERLGTYLHYRRTVEELSQLTDRELTDLGIHRSQIREIARDATGRA